MADEPIDRFEALVPHNMKERGRITLEALLSPVRDVINRRQFPKEPLSEEQVDLLLRLLSSMDTDKDPDAARVGEREGRTASPMIQKLAAGFNHGIGRSGHVTAPQPKAPGASIMQRIANSVALDAIRELGLPNVRAGLVTPLSTGMTLALVFGAFRREIGTRNVIYPRIDHTSPKRAIQLAGLNEKTIPTVLDGDAVVPDMNEFEKCLQDAKNAAVLATTTFFPPRESDPVKAIAKLCEEKQIPLVINNAYGVQSKRVMSEIRSAIDAGRVDAVVQSSDKNFLVPVGGSILVSPRDDIIEQAAETYAGRATAAPVVQTLAALLVLGLEEYSKLQEAQVNNLNFLEDEMASIADSVDERLLSIWNPVACAMTIDGFDAKKIGGRLYNRRVTGPRAVPKNGKGASIDGYPHSYLVMNAAIGASRTDVKQATTRLYKELTEWLKKG
ncbi:MAG: O-phosphoseryl-tRNA(Sec) selenium transferase [Candidatus Lokiarchaeota archaeon]|nr:O-phosphoseryl-tRNA(Sec) selenium transferase [Candidatus Lokiarchaeota archaeon]